MLHLNPGELAPRHSVRRNATKEDLFSTLPRELKAEYLPTSSRRWCSCSGVPAPRSTRAVSRACATAAGCHPSPLRPHSPPSGARRPHADASQSSANATLVTDPLPRPRRFAWLKTVQAQPRFNSSCFLSCSFSILALTHLVFEVPARLLRRSGLICSSNASTETSYPPYSLVLWSLVAQFFLGAQLF